jgi:hypothetical protein
MCAALASGLLLTSGTAEARFGKRSSKSSSKSKVHDAAPVDSSSDDSGDSSDSNSPDTGASLITLISLFSRPAPMPAYTSYYQQEPVAEQRDSMSPVLVRMGLEGQALSRERGTVVALNLGIEGRRWGVAGATSALTLPADDGTDAKDRIQLHSAHLTYALFSSERGRLRVEAGGAIARAPDVTFVGPSVAMSFERCLFGALDVEGRGQFVPAPHLQLDAQVGLGLHLGALTLRGGWRWLRLDDRGHMDGERHRDSFTGPYAGLGLNF